MVEQILVKVAGRSRPGAVAGYMTAQLRHGYPLLVRAVGRRAIEVSVLAITLTRQFLVNDGTDIEVVCVPEVCTIEFDGQPREAMQFHLVDRFDGNHVLPAPSVSDSEEEGE